MTMTHQSGPEVTFGQATVGADKNPDAGPNISYQGDCILDVRPGYNPGQKPAVWSHFDSAYILLLNTTPPALSNTTIVNVQAVAGAGAVTLRSSNGGGVVVGVTIQAPYWNQGSGATVTGLLAMGNTTADTVGATSWLIPSGTTGSVVGRNNIYDPTTMVCRTLRYISSNAGDTTQTITTSGYDVYGNAMSERVTLNGTTQVLGRKTFKYSASVVASAAMAGNLSVGTTDTFGLNLRADLFEQLNIFYNGAFITASTGWTAADATAANITTTTDTRGTYAVQSASDGTKRLSVYLSVSPNQMVTTTNGSPAALYGVTQA